MDSSPPPNLANLNQLFVQFDTDHDGKVNDQQIEEIFNSVGFTDVYSGTIRKVIRLLNENQPDNDTLDFCQLQQYAQAMITKGKFKVWKAKLSYKHQMHELLKQTYKQQQNGASPGAAPGAGGAPGSGYSNQVNNQDGQVSIKIGNTDNFDQYIDFRLQKQKGQQIKPFIKISLERKTHEQAQKIQSLWKSIYDTLIQILKSQQEELISEILSVSFITSVVGNAFNLYITTNNQGLIQLAQTVTDFFDDFIKHPVNGKIEGSYKFNFDFAKFISDANYNFYDLFVRNSSLHIKWNLWDLFHNLRRALLKTDVFEQLKYDATHPGCLFVIGLLHCQKFVGKLEFESTSTQSQQLKSKQQITEFFKDLNMNLKQLCQSTNLPLIQMLEQLDGKISIEVGVRDWRLNFEAKLASFSKLFISQIQHNNQDSDSYNDNNSNEYNENISATEQINTLLIKNSSQKSLKKSSSIKSIDKKASYLTQNYVQSQQVKKSEQQNVQMDNLSQQSSGSAQGNAE